MNRWVAGIVWAVTAAVVTGGIEAAEQEPAKISVGREEPGGAIVHEVRSPFQAGTTRLRVVRPRHIEEGKTYPVVYVLPVEAGVESRFGDGLTEIEKLGLADRLKLVFVAPTFSQLPWYADHPTRPEIRQESHLLEVVAPFVDANYPVRRTAAGRLLLGFSKSGWGAWSLLLRHPDRFGKAVAWDAPLMLDRPGKYGSGDVFGTAENFEQYRIDKLLEAAAAGPQNETRLLLMGYGNFRGDHERAHALLDRLKIPHLYRDGPARKHDWHSGWVREAIELLAEER